MYEADLVQGPLGWVVSRLVLNEAIYTDGPGTDTSESLLFEHIVANLLLKKLDEALWLRFFAAEPTMR
jgi:hypothetical protein